MRDQLHKLLQLANVSGIYIVDDALDAVETVTYEHFFSLIKTAIKENGLAAVDQLDEQFDFEVNEGIIEDYSQGLWDKAERDKQLHYVRVVSTLTPDRQETATEYNIKKVLAQLKSSGKLHNAELFSMSPIEWDEKSENIISGIPTDKKAIVLFDQKLDRAGGRFDRTLGIDLLKEILGHERKTQLITGLLTYTVENEGLELIERARLSNKHDVGLDDLFVLSKERLEDICHFVDGIKKILLSSPSEKIKSKAIEIGYEALSKTVDKLRNLDTYDFNYTVLQSSESEGIWAGETLLRIIDIMFKDEIRNSLLDNDILFEFDKLWKESMTVSRIKVPVDAGKVYTEKYNLRRQELYSIDKNINGLFKPLENGDIFEIDNSGAVEYYILISQACDLVVRNNGKRSSSVAYLLKINMISKADFELSMKEKYGEAIKKKLHKFNFWETNSVLEHLTSDPNMLGIVRLPNAHIINMDVFDLVMFNAEGKAMLNLDQPLVVSLHSGMIKRYNKLKEKYRAMISDMNKYNDSLVQVDEGLKEELLKMLILKTSFTGTLADASIDGSTISFGIRRIKALRDPFARNMLEKYMRFLARTGDLHDFAEFH